MPIRALSFLLVASTVALAQEPAPKPADKPTPPKLGGTEAVQPAPPLAELLASDGKPLAAGRIPEDTAPEARAAWERLFAATLGQGGARKAVNAFALEIDVVGSMKKDVKGPNQIAGLYEYAAPGFVRVRFKESKRELLRGPVGDWLVDPARNEVLPVERKPDDDADVRQLDDMVAIARNFIALTDPKSLRIARLALRAAPPPVVGREFTKRAKELVWIGVESPDFRLTRAPKAGARPTLYEVELGLDPKTSLPEQALVTEGATTAPLAPTTQFLVLTEWFEADGTKVPKQVRTFEIDPRTSAAGATDPLKLAFQRDPTSDVWIVSARMNPPLTAESFRPPKQ
ncbi:MAG: hypothetical protein HZA53_03370 [Planctomycetes bacterium]|nr:hypothetical protein [Planctomycetota bacterium]